MFKLINIKISQAQLLIRSYACISLLLFSVLSHAKIEKTLNTPRNGDKLIGYSINLTSPGNHGSDVTWDFSDIKVKNKEYPLQFISLKEKTDTLLMTYQNARFYCKVIGDTLKDIGYENRLMKVIFDQPKNIIVYPMAYGDSISGYFFGRGNYCERYPMRVLGKYTSKVDACGKLYLPNGETLQNVTRICTSTVHSNIFFQTDSVSIPKENYSNSQIENWLESDEYAVITNEYSWYAQGYRYPIIEFREIYYSPNEEDRGFDANYFSTHEQACLPIDDDNIELRQSDFYHITQISSDNNINDSDVNINNDFNYTFSQDKSLHKVLIEINANSPIDAETILANINGMVYRTVKKTNVYSTNIELDYSDLPRGRYAVYIKAGLNVYTEKFEN